MFLLASCVAHRATTIFGESGRREKSALKSSTWKSSSWWCHTETSEASQENSCGWSLPSSAPAPRLRSSTKCEMHGDERAALHQVLYLISRLSSSVRKACCRRAASFGRSFWPRLLITGCCPFLMKQMKSVTTQTAGELSSFKLLTSLQLLYCNAH